MATEIYLREDKMAKNIVKRGEITKKTYWTDHAGYQLCIQDMDSDYIMDCMALLNDKSDKYLRLKSDRILSSDTNEQLEKKRQEMKEAIDAFDAELQARAKKAD